MRVLKRRINTRRIREPHIKEVCRILKREQQQGLPHVKKKESRQEGAALREKEDSQKKAVHGEENRKETVNCYHL